MPLSANASALLAELCRCHEHNPINHFEYTPADGGGEIAHPASRRRIDREPVKPRLDVDKRRPFDIDGPSLPRCWSKVRAITPQTSQRAETRSRVVVRPCGVETSNSSPVRRFRPRIRSHTLETGSFDSGNDPIIDSHLGRGIGHAHTALHPSLEFSIASSSATVLNGESAIGSATMIVSAFRNRMRFPHNRSKADQASGSMPRRITLSGETSRSCDVDPGFVSDPCLLILSSLGQRTPHRV